MQIDGGGDGAGAGHQSKMVPAGQVLGGLELGGWSSNDLANPINILPSLNADWLEEVPQLLIPPFYVGRTQREGRERGRLCDKTLGISL